MCSPSSQLSSSPFTSYIKQVEDVSEVVNILARESLTVIEFTARHCAHSPQIEKLAKEYLGNVVFLNVDVNDLAPFTATSNITGTPTFQFYRSSVLLSTFSAASLPANAHSPANLVPSIASLIKLFITKYNPGLNKITDDLAFSAQIPEEWVQKLGDVGFRTVIDLSMEGEKDHLSNEKDILKENGVEYTHFPITSINQLTPSTISQFTKYVQALPKPLLVHSRIGLHASILLLAFAAKEYHSTSQDIVDWARDFGYDYEGLPEGNE
ncbi:hypothetical protein G9A89_013643 [Geosiphon pyriformis]|nr:hypothetical protein G9A89_013643 [Geosiphon pyriformis]